ncbi:MAG: ankyrin repeat domain-containing protein [Proteobacteria bacterium]|nr:ankyrin repeat domain-containing protein [Pseudomonadota bacterium]
MEDGATALMLAAIEGHTEVVKLLLDKGADVNSRLETGETALILAAQGGHKEVMELLIKKLSTPSNNPNNPQTSPELVDIARTI